MTKSSSVGRKVPAGAFCRSKTKRNDVRSNYESKSSLPRCQGTAETEAVSLLENNGQVIGVRVKTREGKLEDLQAKDIVIATGGFTANVPMRLKYDER